CRVLCPLQTRRPRAVCTPFRNVLLGSLCLPLLHAGRQLPRSGSGDCCSRHRRSYSVSTTVSAFLCAVPNTTAAFRYASLACGLVVCARVVVAGCFTGCVAAG